MNKIIVGMTIVTILVLAISSFVIVNQVTGAAVATCTSSDGWHNYNIPGRTIGLSYDGKTQLNVVDTCRPDGRLQEFDCIITSGGQNTGKVEEINYPDGIDCNSVILGTVCRKIVENGVFGGACKKACSDSDGGSPFIKGTRVCDGAYDEEDKCFVHESSSSDSASRYAKECSGSKCLLHEYYCKDGQCMMDYANCINGCKDGACLQTTSCSDPDGRDILTKSDCKAPGYPAVSDGCSPDKTKVIEYTCNQNNLCASEWISCPAGKTCSDGACKSISTPTCTDSDGLNYENYGHVSGIQNGQLYDSWDECTSTMMLKEKTCAGVNPSHIFKNCNTLGKTCGNGKCTSSTRSCSASVVCPSGQACINGQCVCPSGYVQSSDGVCRKNGKTCSDPDSSWGKTGEKGSVIDTQTSWQGYIWTDYCDGRALIEFYCDSSDNVQLSKVDCTHGCVNGLCSPQCYDIDGGKNIVVLESIYLNGELKGKDYCFGKGSSVGGKQVNVNYVKEFYCSNNQVVSEDIQSPCPA